MAPALAGEMTHLERILFFQLAAHLALHFCLNLFELMALQAPIVLTSLLNQLELLRKSL
jgi:hypothetical protein